MYKALKFRIKVNKSEEELLNKHVGCSRFVYNYYLGQNAAQNLWQAGKISWETGNYNITDQEYQLC